MVGAMLAPVLFAACSIRNPFGSSSPSGYAAPRRVGDGDCSTELINLSGRPLEVYFFLGLQNPPRNPAAWPRLGVIAALGESLIYADCEHRRMRIRAYAVGPVDPQYESPVTSDGVTLVKGRRETIRLRTGR
jgi:hypothetical protein